MIFRARSGKNMLFRAAALKSKFCAKFHDRGILRDWFEVYDTLDTFE